MRKNGYGPTLPASDTEQHGSVYNKHVINLPATIPNKLNMSFTTTRAGRGKKMRVPRKSALNKARDRRTPSHQIEPPAVRYGIIIIVIIFIIICIKPNPLDQQNESSDS